MASSLRINEQRVLQPRRRRQRAIDTPRVAYIRELRSEDVGFIYRDAPLLMPGLRVFALVAGDGTPLTISESFDAAQADAASYSLATVILH